MGRSRITRTFHNKPVEKSYKPKQSTSIKKVVHKQKFKSTQSKGLIPQAHAQEPKDTPTEVRKSRTAKIKTGRGSPNPLGLFAQGVGNQAHDIGGSVHGLATGKGYEVKSVLNRSLEHAFAGDWDSAGKVISDNPYRFAGNVATEVGLTVVPLGFMARGAGIAGRVGGAVTKVSKGLGKAKFQRKVMTARKKDNTRLFKERGYATGKESRTGVILKSAIGKTKKPKKTKVQKIQKDPWQNPKSPQITGAHIPYERRFGSFANSGDKLSVGIVDSSKLPITKMTMLDGTEKTMGIGAANYAKEGAKRLAWLKKQGLI
jgi:hypothetical protein